MVGLISLGHIHDSYDFTPFPSPFQQINLTIVCNSPNFLKIVYVLTELIFTLHLGFNIFNKKYNKRGLFVSKSLSIHWQGQSLESLVNFRKE